MKNVLVSSATLFLLLTIPGVTTGMDSNTFSISADPAGVMADWEYNTGGTIDFVPNLGGNSAGWGEWFITTVHNNTGNGIHLIEFGFPCCGDETETYGWVIWTGMGGLVAPSGDVTTCDFSGGPFSPVDPSPDTDPPTTYTYIDISSENIIIAAGDYFCFGYDNTGYGGQTNYNGVDTWSWYFSEWASDAEDVRTAILQVKGNYVSSLSTLTWGGIKSLSY